MPFYDMGHAADLLINGEALVYPTETFYAIGCLYNMSAAIDRIYAIKKRSPGKPLSLLAGSMDQVEMIADIRGLMAVTEKFWPGPLTILAPARAGLNPRLKNAENKIAVRISPHPVARELANRANGPLIATSANMAGDEPVAHERALSPEFLDQCRAFGCQILKNRFYMDPAQKPTTIIDFVGEDTIRILREGALSTAELERANLTIV